MDLLSGPGGDVAFLVDGQGGQIQVGLPNSQELVTSIADPTALVLSFANIKY